MLQPVKSAGQRRNAALLAAIAIATVACIALAAMGMTAQGQATVLISTSDEFNVSFTPAALQFVRVG